MESDVMEMRTEAATVLERCVCLTLSCHYLGNNRKVDLEQLVEASGGTLDAVAQQQLHAVKRLVDTRELRPPMRLLGKAKQLLRGLAISGHRVFGERSYLVPLAMVERADEGLRSIAAELAAESTALAARYGAAVERQREALGALFDAAQYPTAEEVERAFGLDWDYISFACPDRLERVDRALFERAQSRYEQRMADAYAEIRTGLRQLLRQITADLVERLAPHPDGRRRVIRGTALDDLREYLETFSFRNVTDDDELSGVVSRLQALTAGLDVEVLKQDERLLARARSEAAEAVARLEVLVERRAISFDDNL